MKFREKIETILQKNSVGVNSIKDLEKYIGVANDTIGKAYNQNREPSIKTMKKLFEKLNVNVDWWQHETGPPFYNSYNQSTNEIYESMKKEILVLTEFNNFLKDQIAKKDEQLLKALNELSLKKTKT